MAAQLAYDYLILATGPEAAFDEIEGLDPAKGAVHSVVHIEDAAKAYADYQQFVKNPGPIVIGAVQNSSILGPVYEFAFLADADLRRRNLRDRVPITLITPGALCRASRTGCGERHAPFAGTGACRAQY